MASIPLVERLKEKIRIDHSHINLMESEWVFDDYPMAGIEFDGISPKHYISKPIIDKVLDEGKVSDRFVTLKTERGFDNSTKKLNLEPILADSSQWLSYSKSTRDEHVDHRIRLDGIANTLNTGYGCSNQSTTNYVLEKSGIYRFLRFPTPRECERLQTWPVDHTRYGRKIDGSIYEISTTQRYAMCGNGVTSKMASAIIDSFVHGDSISVGSFCSGVAGIELMLGSRYRTLFYCENDPDCSAVLRYIHQDIPNHGDLKLAVNGELPKVDLVTMGWPCQDVSVSGKSVGESGERTVVVYDIIRWIGKHKPRYIFGENVKNHLSKAHEGFFIEILSRLSDLGYQIDFDVLPSTKVGVPQFRERVYLKAWL